MVLMNLMLLGSALWFFYDGYIAWPAEAERYQTFTRLADELIAEEKAVGPKDPAVTRAWERYAEKNDLKTKVPKDRTPSDLAGQRIIGQVFFAGWLIFTIWVLLQHRLSVRAEGEIVTGTDGRQVHLDAILEIDRRKWNSKGIAYAIYDDAGKRRWLTLDDHKSIGCEAIILEADKRIAARAAATDTTPPAPDDGAAPS
jgi:hypothetical protein